MTTNFTQLTEEQQKKRLKLVIEGTRLGMWDWNPQTNEVAFNDIWAEMLGYTLDEISPSLDEWESRVHPDDLASCYEDITRHMEGNAPFYENIHRMKHKQGHWVYILDRGKIVERDNDGNPTRFTGTHTDVSKQKYAELEALEAAEAKSRFLANMSHEIRTPLTGVIGMTEILSRLELGSEASSYVNTIRDCAETLMHTLNDILDFAKLEQDSIKIIKQSFSLKKLLSRVTELFEENAFAKGLKIELVYLTPIPDFIVCDEHRIRQVLNNFLSNAIKFTSEGGITLSVSAQKQANDSYDINLSVTDTGIGIENLDTIWDRFEQDNQMIASNYGGTGLGLAIVKSLAEKLDGKVSVTSTLGKGSTFSITLPVTKGADPKERINQPNYSDYTGLSVLVSEDNKINQVIITMLLDQLNIKPKIVNNGLEAINAAFTNDYDIIFLDLHMPIMGGIEAAKKMVENGIHEKSPIYALTADAMSDVCDLCKTTGFQGVITKPYDLNDICLALSTAKKLI